MRHLFSSAPQRKSSPRSSAFARANRFFACFCALVLFSSLPVFAPSRAFADPDDAVPPREDGTVGIYSASNGADRAPDDNKQGIEDGDAIRDEQGIVSQLSTNTHNPYNGQIRLDIDIGSEFAYFEGCYVSEGIREKVSPGGIVYLPPLRARNGYYFVGWGQGGVPIEPTWDPFVTEVEMEDDTSDGRNTSIFALYADDEGNGYCTCGAYEAGVYKNRLEEIKADNALYNDTIGYKGDGTSFGDAHFISGRLASVAVLAVICALIALCAVIRVRVNKRSGEKSEDQDEDVDAHFAESLASDGSEYSI